MLGIRGRATIPAQKNPATFLQHRQGQVRRPADFTGQNLELLKASTGFSAIVPEIILIAHSAAFPRKFCLGFNILPSVIQSAAWAGILSSYVPHGQV
jgi:hypothetical protein